MAIGYGIGLLLTKLIKKIVRVKIDEKYSKPANFLLLTAWIILPIIYFSLAGQWQGDVRKLVSLPPIDRTYSLRIAVLAIVSGFLLLGLSRSIRALTRKIIKLAEKRLPHRTSSFVGVIAVVLFFVLFFNVLLTPLFVGISNNTFSNVNSTTDTEVTKPTSELRSGGPGSLVSWESLGRQGRNFSGGGPSKKDIEKFSGKKAIEPIRVYVGLKTKDTIKERAELAVKELERTKAFERKILVIANTTGSGWLESQATDSIEYMYGGDSAIAAIQYSYLPSWIAFLTEINSSTDAGKAIFDAIYQKWSSMDELNRPTLVTYGLSLGAFSGQAAFDKVEDIAKIDGALFVGPPSDSKMWRNLVESRDKGSREILPVYNQGRTVRFASNANQIQQNQSGWEHPRVIYLQHATDAVIWWNYELLYRKPDWLKEKHGPDVSPRMGWHPVVTFWQVTVDQMLSTNVPSGYGHNYGNVMVASWAAIAKPQDWTVQDTLRLQKLIDGYSIE